MVQLRKNQFIEMLDTAKIFFDDKDKFIHCHIPTLGKITYYPKANKIQISKTNTWEENGFEYVSNILNSTTSIRIEETLIGIPSEKEIKKSQDIFYLMVLAKMSLTEINTLTENERILLSEFFVEKSKKEEELIKKEHKP